jgi:hypothetical protein
MRVISIDPDVRQSGYAEYLNGKLVYCTSMYIWQLFNYIRDMSIDLIVIEDSRLIKCSTWHEGGRGASKNVGKNQAIAIILEDYCKARDENYLLVKPDGYSKRFSNIEYFKEATGYKERTNLDARAAAAIGWKYRNYEQD